MNCMHLPTSVRCTSDVQHVHILLFSDLHKEKHVAFEFSLFLHFPQIESSSYGIPPSIVATSRK